MISVLCAEDDPHVQGLVREILKRRYDDVRIVDDGLELVKAMDERLPDVILLDLNMPNMDGMQVLDFLRSNPAATDLPVVVVSAHGNEDTIVEAFSKGAWDYIAKPFSAAELLAKLKVIVTKRQAMLANNMDLAIGSTVAGRYQIVRRMQSAGFSTVYLAKDVVDPEGGDVAIKFFDLPISKRSDRRFVSLFLREAYEVSKLDHPSIVKFLEFGQAGQHYYLVMEYLEGQTLADWVAAEGPLPYPDLLGIGCAIGRAIRYMAKHNIIHRDIKPQNIMMCENGEVKLADFGLAKQQTDQTLSLSQEFHGTPSFVSPEYISGNRQIDVRSDIYSLGATLYYAATSVILFAGRTPEEILQSHQDVVPPPLSDFDHGVEKEISLLVDCMLAKRPDDRPDIDEIIETFDRSRKKVCKSEHQRVS